MEFCITLLVKSFEPGPEFSLPERFPMALGEAYRSEDVGKYFWPGGLDVMETPTLLFLQKFLPPDFQLTDWIFLSLGPYGFADFEAWVNQKESEDWEVIVPQEHPLPGLVRHLLNNQPQWAAFVLRDCEDLAVSRRQSVSELCKSLTYAYRWGGDLPVSGGFCSYSRV